MPKFKVEKAILDRIVVIPYENEFQIDNGFKDIMMGKLDLLFSFIMKYGEVKDKFDLTEKMIKFKEEYKEENVVDNLGDFINSNYKRVEGKKVLRETFVKDYNSWLKSNDKPVCKYTFNKFTSTLKKKYNIESKPSNSKYYYMNLEKIFEEDIEEEV
jgi:hypothetical protein